MLAEVAQTVDDVVVINHGRLVVQAPLAELVDGGRRAAVSASARRSREAARRRRRLGGPGRRPDRDPTHPHRLGRRPGRRSPSSPSTHGILVYEITAESASLEETFLDLTSHQRPGGPAMTAIVRAQIVGMRTLRMTYVVPPR